MNAPMSRVLPTPVARAKQSDGNSRSKSVTDGNSLHDGLQGGLDIHALLRRGDLRDPVQDLQRPPLRRAEAQPPGDGVDVAVHALFPRFFPVGFLGGNFFRPLTMASNSFSTSVGWASCLTWNFSNSPSALASRHFVADPARVGQDLPLAQAQEVVQLGDPVAHVHRPAVQGLQLGEFQVGGDDPVEGVELLGGAGSSWRSPTSAFADRSPAPGRQAHVRLGSRRPGRR